MARDRKRKRVNKYRGNRLHGKGDTKHNRGKGSHGGKGRAGSWKHHKSRYYLEQRAGHKITLNAKSHGTALNLDDVLEHLPQWEREGKVKREGNAWVVDGAEIGVSKLLSRGKLNQALILRNILVSKKTKEKIMNAQGKIEGMEEETEGIENEEEMRE